MSKKSEDEIWKAFGELEYVVEGHTSRMTKDKQQYANAVMENFYKAINEILKYTKDIK